MNNFGSLFKYECKKLLRRKIVWISFSLCMITVILSLVIPLFGNYYIDGKFIDTNYNLYQMHKQNAEALDGREINQSLIEEAIAAYRKIPETPPDQHYTSTDAYQQYTQPYSEIFNFIRNTTNMQTSEVMRSWQPSEDDMYAKRQIMLTSMWENYKLSSGEMDFWRKREAQIKTPFVYQEHGGYDTIFTTYQVAGLFILMLMAICLSGMFSDEHTRKTDQIILSSPLGKAKLYWTKIAVGISFAAISTLLFLVFTFVITICLYGAGGFHAAFQLMFVSNSDPVTCGQAIIIAYGNMLFAAILASVFVMVLSEWLRSNIATLAISTGMLLLCMIVNVPEQYRVLAQIWNWLPLNYLVPWNVFGSYTVSLFGHYLTPWQAVPVIYLVISAVIAVFGKPIYERFEVSGR